MTKSKSFVRLAMLTLLSVFALTGCVDSALVEQEKISRDFADRMVKKTETMQKMLAQDLDGKKLANARLIDTYAQQLMKDKPELKAVIGHFQQEASSKGALFQGLQDRLGKVDQELGMAKQKLDHSKKENADYKLAIQAYQQKINPELDALNGASQKAVFNEALADIANTMAEMSGGKLPRVDGKKSEDFYRESGAKNHGPGTLLVGNENYGQWKTDSSGNSFWEFYGQYMFLTQLMGGFNQPVYYNSWGHYRPYSYYNDHGSRYASQRYKSTTSSLNKKYGSARPIAAQRHIQKNPTVTQKFKKFDSAYKPQRPSVTRPAGSLRNGSLGRSSSKGGK